MNYWVCSKGEKDKHGTIVSNFMSMLHYYLLYTHGNDKAEIYAVGYDENLTERFLKIARRYWEMEDELEKLVVDNFNIPLEE